MKFLKIMQIAEKNGIPFGKKQQKNIVNCKNQQIKLLRIVYI